MAGNYWPPPGLHNVGSYQVSGVPWITGSNSLGPDDEHKIKFPYVTQNVTVIMHSAASNGIVRVHFASKANAGVVSGLHYIELDSDEDSITLPVKCTNLYVSAPDDGGVRTYRVVAALTNIPSGSMSLLTGSGITDADAS
tara:strand:- start:1082 stop:1501 length:420 start_codon:yes stop_codon:yes gene_type:complete